MLTGHHPGSWKALLPLFCANQEQHRTGPLSCHVFTQHLVQQSLDVISPLSCNDINNNCKAFPPELSQLQTSNSLWPSSPQDPIPTSSSTTTGFHGDRQHGSGSCIAPALPPPRLMLQHSPYMFFLLAARLRPWSNTEKFAERLPLTRAGFGSGAASKVCPSQIPVTGVQFLRLSLNTEACAWTWLPCWPFRKPLLILLGFFTSSGAACGFASGSGYLLMACSSTSAFQEEFTAGFITGFW